MEPNREPTTQITKDPALLAGGMRPLVTVADGAIGDLASLDIAMHGTPPSLDPMSAVTGHPAKAGYNVRGYVADCLDHGSDPVDLRRQLIALGYKPENAERIVQEMMIARLRLRALSESIAGSGPEQRRDASVRAWIMPLGTIVIVMGVVGLCAGVVTEQLIAQAGFALILAGASIFARGAEWATRHEMNDYRTRRGHPSSKMDGRPPWRSGTEESPL